MIRVGQGFDIHRLSDGVPFMLGGVQLDFSKGSKGHSDGDVLIHALIDAMLGASGLGDIGEWFPSSDPAYAGASGATLLKPLLEKMTRTGLALVNVDATVILEAPKLAQYKAPIRESLAALLDLDPSFINIKAKTMEGLGAVGKGEAVSAMVNVLVEKVA